MCYELGYTLNTDNNNNNNNNNKKKKKKVKYIHIDINKFEMPLQSLFELIWKKRERIV